MYQIKKVRSKQDIIARICDQVSNLPDIRLLLMRSTEPPRELRTRIINALTAYVADGKPIVGEQAPKLADEIIQSRRYDLNNVLVRARKDVPDKPYRGPRLKSGAIAEARDVTKEDRISDLSTPTFNTPAPDEVHIMEDDEKTS